MMHGTINIKKEIIIVCSKNMFFNNWGTKHRWWRWRRRLFWGSY